MNDEEISFEISCDEYIEIFNGLMNISRIVYSIGVSPIAFSNSYIFKKGGTLSIMSFLELKVCNKLSRSVSLGFKHKDLRVHSFEKGEFDVDQKPKAPPNLISFMIHLFVVDYVK